MTSISRRAVPALTTEQMREVDRVMVDDLHIELVQMMENAGRNLAELAITGFGAADVVVLGGPGGNGGGGLVAARHLANRGSRVTVVLSDPDHMTPVPTHQLDILRRMDIALADEPPSADLIIDALIGYSLRGHPMGRAAELISWTNEQVRPVLSLDTPSGLDVTTGVAATPCVRATATMTLALPKLGLLEAPEVGALYLADISVPSVVFRRMGIEVGSIFRDATIVKLTA
jgi:NAD(P)H-hydrate epimerase